MKKTFSVILITVMLIMLLVPVTGCGAKADYASPHDAVVAADKGFNIIGKTVKVKATTDVTLGYFYGDTDLSVGANVSVGVYKPNDFLGLDMDYEGIREGQTVICTIRDYDDHLKTSRILLVEPIK